jgi:hypothetical protein
VSGSYSVETHPPNRGRSVSIATGPVTPECREAPGKKPLQTLVWNFLPICADPERSTDQGFCVFLGGRGGRCGNWDGYWGNDLFSTHDFFDALIFFCTWFNHPRWS